MKLEGQQRIDSPRQRVWEALNDTRVLRIDATAAQLAAKFFSRFTEIVKEGIGSDAVVADAAAGVMQVVARLTVAGTPSPSHARGAPWEWVVVAVLAIIAGFLIGRSPIGMWWIVMTVATVIAIAGAGYSAGKRDGVRT